MASSERPSGASGRGSLYGGLPDQIAPGLTPQLVHFCEELRDEGVKIGTAELLDAFSALGEVSWTDREDFRETLAATLAKSQQDRRVFERTMSIIVKHRTDLDVVAERVGVRLEDGLLGRAERS